jgi:hypothetical protein
LITIGAPSTWTVDASQTLTLGSKTPLNLNLSTLTIDGAGATNLNSVISDVTTNSTFAGLLTGYTGSLIKTGSGTLTLTAGTNTFSSPLKKSANKNCKSLWARI